MLKITETIKIAALTILKKVATKILKFKLLGKGLTPWVYYEDKLGKKRATFLKKSSFQGYEWHPSYNHVTNLETGKTYSVNNTYCSCKDWYYRVRTGQKNKCKYQLMREKIVPDEIIINDKNLPTGCFTRKYESKKSIEHRLYAWVRKFNGEEYYPEPEEVGKILISNFNGLEAWTKTAINGINFDSINDAINYLLRKANINLQEVAQAYQYAEYSNQSPVTS